MNNESVDSSQVRSAMGMDSVITTLFDRQSGHLAQPCCQVWLEIENLATESTPGESMAYSLLHFSVLTLRKSDVLP